ncbi:hypothetical protein DYI95_007965 [Thermaerobacter sp. PB12/4term]|uniref:hypothetical protein n=1 Tax=Thermaerobacter sp. PB12/4term TaxID=2293838 RepID=UPI000E32C8E6|nr:hypothetical protein [Thermaerobacter sp. PB12/4term]QIA27467.1 hypothetical protein DYI95_007965 [Thermaerobacter sp. PB12/4term]
MKRVVRRGWTLLLGLVLVLGVYSAALAASGNAGPRGPNGAAVPAGMRAVHHPAMAAARAGSSRGPTAGAGMDAMHQTMMNMSSDEMIRLCQAHHTAMTSGAAAATK